jgi:hypothetical protein
MWLNTMLLWLILELGIFLGGYATGRRIGKKEGLEAGLALTPLIFREKMLETAYCPICGRKLNDDAGCDKISME